MKLLIVKLVVMVKLTSGNYIKLLVMVKLVLMVKLVVMVKLTSGNCQDARHGGIALWYSGVLVMIVKLVMRVKLVVMVWWW